MIRRARVLALCCTLLAMTALSGVAQAETNPVNQPPAAEAPTPRQLPSTKPYLAVADTDTAATSTPAPILSSGTAALVANKDAGAITAEQFTKYALGKLGYGYRVPGAYDDAILPSSDAEALALSVNLISSRLSSSAQTQISKDVAASTGGKEAVDTGSTTSTSSMLSTGSGGSTQKTTTARSGAGAMSAVTTTTFGCGTDWKYKVKNLSYGCSGVSDHFVIYYNVGAKATVDLTDSDNDGVPDAAREMLVSAELARETSVSILGYRQPAVTYIFTDSALLKLNDSTGAALPLSKFAPPSIHLFKAADPTYLVRHEVFHQVQYRYIPAYASGPISAGLAFKNITAINWWMEATAEWAAHQAMYSYFTMAPSRLLYFRSNDVFLNDLSNDIAATDGFGGARQYGAVLLAEWV
jgi:hypothetical protein